MTTTNPNGTKNTVNKINVSLCFLVLMLIPFIMVVSGQAKKVDEPVIHANSDLTDPDHELVLKPFVITHPMCYENKIEVEPSNPTGADNIIINPSGLWCDICVPKYDSHHISGRTIRIYAGAGRKNSVCADVATPWEFNVDMGVLPAGEYTVEMYISRLGDSYVLNDVTAFSVKEPVSVASSVKSPGLSKGSETAGEHPDIDMPFNLDKYHDFKMVYVRPMCFDNCLYVNPPKPVVGENVEFIISGTWCDNCVPKYKFHSIDGRVIRIYAGSSRASASCIPTPTGWSFNVDVGSLKPGDHMVEYYISRCGNPYILQDTTMFKVMEPSLP